MNNKDIENITCGIAFFYNDNILLVHNSKKDFNGNYSIPKGHIHVGERRKDCAIREVYEETGIKIDRKELGKRNKISFNNKTLYYYVVIVNDLKKIGLKTKVIKQKKLQLEEINWAGFITLKKAIDIINPPQIKILTDHVNGTESNKYIINYDKFVNELS